MAVFSRVRWRTVLLVRHPKCLHAPADGKRHVAPGAYLNTEEVGSPTRRLQFRHEGRVDSAVHSSWLAVPLDLAKVCLLHCLLVGACVLDQYNRFC